MSNLVNVDPNTTTGPACQHSHSKSRGRVDKSQTDSVEVDPVGAPLLGDELDTDQDVGNSENGKDTGGDDGALGDSSTGSQDLANGFPGNDGDQSELALLNGSVDDAVVGLGVEDEQGHGGGNGKDGTDTLGQELGARGSTQQVTGLQVSNHVDGLGADGGRDVGAHEVGLLDDLDFSREAGEDELGDLADGSRRVDIGLSGGLKTDKGEDEGEDDGEDGRVDGNLEVEGHKADGEDCRDQETRDPPEGRDLLVRGDGVLADVVGRVGELGALCDTTDQVAGLTDSTSNTMPEGLAVDTEFTESSKDHEGNAGPEEPRLGRTVVGPCEPMGALEVSRIDHQGASNTVRDKLSEHEGEDSRGRGHHTGTKEGEIKGPSPSPEFICMLELRVSSRATDPVEDVD